VAEGLAQHVRRTGAAPVRAARVRLPKAYDGEHLPDGAHHKGDRDDRDRQRHHSGDDLRDTHPYSFLLVAGTPDDRTSDAQPNPP
jgi:hypothetical protein